MNFLAACYRRTSVCAKLVLIDQTRSLCCFADRIQTELGKRSIADFTLALRRRIEAEAEKQKGYKKTANGRQATAQAAAPAIAVLLSENGSPRRMNRLPVPVRHLAGRTLRAYAP